MVNRRRPRKPRPYDSSARKARAEATRARILEVAQSLFAERGYRETTMDAIADASGAALPSVYAAYGSKRGLLKALLDTRVSGDPTGESVLKSAGARAVFDEPDRSRALAMFAEHMSTIQERVASTYGVIRSAAPVDPEIAEMHVRAQEARYANLRAFANRLAERGPLRKGLSIDDAARTIWILTSIEARELLAKHAGWSREHYASWLASTLVAALLPSRS
jgi:AcrR family transcriptional regulator